MIGHAPFSARRPRLLLWVTLAAVAVLLTWMTASVASGQPSPAGSAGPAAAGAAQRRPRARVVDVVTDTGEVHDSARFEGRTLLATNGGLVVLRGGRVQRVITARHGLPGSRLRSVSVIDHDVYVGGVEGLAVLSLQDPSQGADAGDAPSSSDPEFVVVRRLPLRRVRRVLRFSGALYAASYGDGLFRLPSEGRPAQVHLGRSHARRRLSDLRVVGDELWVATAGAGVLRLDRGGSVVGRLTDRRGLSSDFVFALSPHRGRASAAHTVLVATMSGLDVVRIAAEPEVQRDHALHHAAATLSIRDLRGVGSDARGVVVGSFGGGAHRLGNDGRAQRIGDDTITRVLSIRLAGEDMIIGHHQGAHRARDAAELIGRGMPHADITAVERAFGRVFVGTFAHGLGVLRRGRVRDLPRATSRWGVDRRVNDLLRVTSETDGERLYIATDRGLFWHDGRRFTPVEDPHAPGRVHVTSLYRAPDGALWVTSSRMLSRYHGGRWTSYGGDARFPVMQLHAVTIDRRGQVWVGSLHGLFRLNPDDGTFDRFTVSSGHLPVDWVTALLPHGDGVVAGTYHGGLVYLEASPGAPGGVSASIEREESGRGARRGQDGGLPSGWVNPHALRRAGDLLLVGTLEGGLAVGRTHNWTRLSTRGGLPSDDVTDAIRNPDGTWWVATRGGLARIRVSP